MRRYPVLLLMFGSLLLFACGEDQEPEAAEAFWDKIQEAEYRTWSRAPGFGAIQPSRALHGDKVMIYVNDVVDDALEDGTLTEYPVGSIIVKDGYTGGDICLIAGMEKREDGEWFFTEYRPSGRTLYSGQPELCTGCHAIGDDWVRGFFLN